MRLIFGSLLALILLALFNPSAHAYHGSYGYQDNYSTRHYQQGYRQGYQQGLRVSQRRTGFSQGFVRNGGNFGYARAANQRPVYRYGGYAHIRNRALNGNLSYRNVRRYNSRYNSRFNSRYNSRINRRRNGRYGRRYNRRFNRQGRRIRGNTYRYAPRINRGYLNGTRSSQGVIYNLY